MANFLKALNDATATTAHVATHGVTTAGNTIVTSLDGLQLGIDNIAGRLENQRDLELATRRQRYKVALMTRVKDLDEELLEAAREYDEVQQELVANPNLLKLVDDTLAKYDLPA